MWTIQLPVPPTNQLAGVTTDARADENALFNCGPSSVASVVKYVTGVTFLADEVKDITWQLTGRKPETSGVTNEHDLQLFLSERCGIDSTVYTVASKGDSMSVIRKYLFQGKPVIVLRSFTAPGSSDGHWCTVIGGDGADDTHTSHLLTWNPWGAFLMTETNDVFFSWQKQDYPSTGVRLLLGIDTPRNPLF